MREQLSKGWQRTRTKGATSKGHNSKNGTGHAKYWLSMFKEPHTTNLGKLISLWHLTLWHLTLGHLTMICPGIVPRVIRFFTF